MEVGVSTIIFPTSFRDQLGLVQGTLCTASTSGEHLVLAHGFSLGRKEKPGACVQKISFSKGRTEGTTVRVPGSAESKGELGRLAVASMSRCNGKSTIKTSPWGRMVRSAACFQPCTCSKGPPRDRHVSPVAQAAEPAQFEWLGVLREPGRMGWLAARQPEDLQCQLWTPEGAKN